jgi:formate hydrogenlyase subunit 3/multisubunit Na+/H+ antiporter MnhD subunit
MLISIVLIPALLGLLSILLPYKKIRRGLLIAGSISHLTLTVILGFMRNNAYNTGDWIGLDNQGLLFLVITSILFLMVSIYTAGYLWRESDRNVRTRLRGSISGMNRRLCLLPAFFFSWQP